MRINTRFPVAIHIMVTAAFFKSKTVTSEALAKSVNTNPVVIRRTCSLLKASGLINVRSGVGGVYLNKDPKDITLLDIYKATRSPDQSSIFDMHQNPNPLCPIGANIHEALSAPLLAAQQEMEKKLSEFTLQDIIKSIAESSGLAPDEGR